MAGVAGQRDRDPGAGEWVEAIPWRRESRLDIPHFLCYGYLFSVLHFSLALSLDRTLLASLEAAAGLHRQEVDPRGELHFASFSAAEVEIAGVAGASARAGRPATAAEMFGELSLGERVWRTL